MANETFNKQHRHSHNHTMGVNDPGSDMYTDVAPIVVVPILVLGLAPTIVPGCVFATGARRGMVLLEMRRATQTTRALFVPISTRARHILSMMLPRQATQSTRALSVSTSARVRHILSMMLPQET